MILIWHVYVSQRRNTLPYYPKNNLISVYVSIAEKITIVLYVNQLNFYFYHFLWPEKTSHNKTCEPKLCIMFIFCHQIVFLSHLSNSCKLHLGWSVSIRSKSLDESTFHLLNHNLMMLNTTLTAMMRHNNITHWK